MQCGTDANDAEHTFFKCERWAELGAKLATEVGDVTPDNVIKIMLDSEKHWEVISTYVEEILRQKKKEEIQVARTP